MRNKTYIIYTVDIEYIIQYNKYRSVEIIKAKEKKNKN